MKLLITLISTFLFIIQVPVQAEEVGHHSSQPADAKVRTDTLINEYKTRISGDTLDAIIDRLSDEKWDKILLIANDLLDNFIRTNDTKIIDGLLACNQFDFTFLHYAVMFSNGEIIKKTIEALKDRPDLQKSLLLATDNNDDTFLQIAAEKGRSEIIQITIESLKERLDILEKLLLNTPQDTIFHTAVKNNQTEIIQTTIDAISDDPFLLNLLYMATDEINDDTLLHIAAKKDDIVFIYNIIDSLRYDSDILFDLLYTENKDGKYFVDYLNSGGVFLSQMIDIIILENEITNFEKKISNIEIIVDKLEQKLNGFENVDVNK